MSVIRVRVRTLWRASAQTDATVNTLQIANYTDYAGVTPPTAPPTGKGRVFLDATDGQLKIKKADGSVVSLEAGGGSGTDEKVKVAVDGVQVSTLARKLDFRSEGDIVFTVTEDTTNDQFDIKADIKAGVIVDADIATNAAIAKSKISTAGTWAKTDLPPDTVYTNDVQTLQNKTLVNPTIKDVDATPVADRQLRVVDGQIQATDTTGVEGRYIRDQSIAGSGVVVPQLNADMVDGQHAANFAPATHSHGRADLPAQIAYKDEPNTFTQANDFQATLQVPRKTDPTSPVVGEVWIDGKVLKYRDNQATPQTQVVELQSNKGVANGYASLDASALVPTSQLGTGTPSATNALLGNRTWGNPAPAAHAASHQHGGSDEIATATPAANAIPKAGADGKLSIGWLSDNARTIAIGITIGDGVNVITTGFKGAIPVPVAGTIVEWTVISTDANPPTTGSITIDILKSDYSGYPASLTSITGTGTKPNITNAQKGQGNDFTGWTTTSIAAGDIVAFNVTAVTSLKRVTLVLKVVKS